MTTPDGQTINYSYDATGRLSQIIPNGGQPFNFTYDAGGRRTALSYPNGVTANYAYDTQNNLTGLTYNTSTSATIDSFSYTYDNAGNRLTRADADYQYGYAYDAVYEVTQCLATQVAQSPTFQLYTEAFTYDPVGNRLTGPGYSKPAGYAQNYFYDYEHRLVKVVNQLGSNVDTITFKYDPFGRRIEKNVDTVENNLPTTYNYVYVYDGDDIILEVLNKTQNGTTTTITTSYVHGPGIDEPLSLTRDGQTYYYHADGLGSITSVTDATQTVANRYAYDTYGVMKRSETIWNDFGFAGREYDSETGLYYLRARYYDPETGKFISKDPIGFNGGDVNLYRYSRNSTINYKDPSGLLLGNLSGGWGKVIGSTVGGAVGRVIGVAVGIEVGMELGFLYGGALGLPAGPLGSLAGGIVGGAVGGVVGGVTVGWAGSQVGGKLGEHFIDSPCAGSVNCDEPIPLNLEPKIQRLQLPKPEMC